MINGGIRAKSTCIFPRDPADYRLLCPTAAMTREKYARKVLTGNPQMVIRTPLSR